MKKKRGKGVGRESRCFCVLEIVTLLQPTSHLLLALTAKRRRRHDLPTPESPISSSLKRKSLQVTDAVDRETMRKGKEGKGRSQRDAGRAG